MPDQPNDSAVDHPSRKGQIGCRPGERLGGRVKGTPNKATVVGRALRDGLLHGMERAELVDLYLKVTKKKGQLALKGKGSREFAELIGKGLALLPREDTLMLGRAETIYVGPGALQEAEWSSSSETDPDQAGVEASDG